MKCSKCTTEMKIVNMKTAIVAIPPYLSYQKDIWTAEKRSAIECYVCAECGNIELKAKNPEVFKGIDNNSQRPTT